MMLKVEGSKHSYLDLQSSENTNLYLSENKRCKTPSCWVVLEVKAAIGVTRLHEAAVAPALFTGGLQ